MDKTPEHSSEKNRSWDEYGILIRNRLRETLDPNKPPVQKITISDLLQPENYQDELYTCWKDIYAIFLEARDLWNKKKNAIGDDTIQEKYHRMVQAPFLDATHTLIAHVAEVNDVNPINDAAAKRLFTFCARIVNDWEKLPASPNSSGNWQNTFFFIEMSGYLLSNYGNKYPIHADLLKKALLHKNVRGLL